MHRTIHTENQIFESDVVKLSLKFEPLLFKFLIFFLFISIYSSVIRSEGRGTVYHLLKMKKKTELLLGVCKQNLIIPLSDDYDVEVFFKLQFETKRYITVDILIPENLL